MKFTTAIGLHFHCFLVYIGNNLKRVITHIPTLHTQLSATPYKNTKPKYLPMYYVPWRAWKIF